MYTYSPVQWIHGECDLQQSSSTPVLAGGCWDQRSTDLQSSVVCERMWCAKINGSTAKHCACVLDSRPRPEGVRIPLPRKHRYYTPCTGPWEYNIYDASIYAVCISRAGSAWRRATRLISGFGGQFLVAN